MLNYLKFDIKIKKNYNNKFTICVTFHLTLTVYSYHFELENGVTTTPKRHSILPLIFTCLCIKPNNKSALFTLGK